MRLTDNFFYEVVCWIWVVWVEETLRLPLWEQPSLEPAWAVKSHYHACDWWIFSKDTIPISNLTLSPKNTLVPSGKNNWGSALFCGHLNVGLVAKSCSWINQSEVNMTLKLCSRNWSLLHTVLAALSVKVSRSGCTLGGWDLTKHKNRRKAHYTCYYSGQCRLDGMLDRFKVWFLSICIFACTCGSRCTLFG
jgi:hypothetical protein